ncbi:MAG: copper amine oxidase N-terminal domain-containing protein [Defluviitaleaceae bacterium]|nr:copper amine oxidase N-terminal domain-containing protein [Defluviitaleaceae bacterium]
MKLKRRIASLLAFVMAFSTIAAFSVSADVAAPTSIGIEPFSTPTPWANASDAITAINSITSIQVTPAVIASEGHFDNFAAFTTWLGTLVPVVDLASATGFAWPEVVATGATGDQVTLPAGNLDTTTTPSATTFATNVNTMLGAVALIPSGTADRLNTEFHSAFETFAGTVAGAVNVVGAPAVFGWPTITNATLPGAAANFTTAQLAALNTFVAARGALTMNPPTNATTAISAGAGVLAYPADEAMVRAALGTMIVPPPAMAVPGLTPSQAVNFPRPFAWGPVGTLEQNWFFVDRYVQGAEQNNHDLGAAAGDRPTLQAAEVVIPGPQLPMFGGSFTLQLTEWGANPWNHMFNNDNIHQIASTVSVNPWGEVNNITLLPEHGRFYQLNANTIVYSGRRADANSIAEIPLFIQRSGQTLTITPQGDFAGRNDIVARVPILANITLGVVPTLTMRGIGADVEVPFTTAGGGVTASVTAVTARNDITLNQITINENAYGAILGGGQVAITFPMGWTVTDRPSVVLGGLAANTTPSWPSHVVDPGTGAFMNSLPRDGIIAPVVMVVNLNTALNRPSVGIRSGITISGLRLVNTANPWDAPVEGSLYATFSTGPDASGIMPAGQGNANNIGLRQAYRTINNVDLRVAEVRDFDISFVRSPATGGVGNIPTIVAGWLPAPGNQAGRTHVSNHERGVGRNVTTGAAAYGNSASVRFEEVVPRSAWTAHTLTFTLVDADGNPHPYATIRNVNFQPDVIGVTGEVANNMPHRVTGNFINQRAAATAANPNYQGTGTITGNAAVIFDETGRSVTVSGLSLATQIENVWRNGRIRLDAHFGITADVSFAGNVYVQVTNGGRAFTGNFGEIDLPQVQIAEVRRGVYVETEVTEVRVGFQTFGVADITIHETMPGDFRSGHDIRLSLGEYFTGQVSGDANVQFIPLTTLQAQNHISVGGADRVQDRAAAHLAPFHHITDELVVTITRPTNANATTTSYISLTDLNVRLNRAVPHGDYQLVVRGSSVLNNENFYGNLNVAGNGNFLRPNETNFRRYPHTPLMIDFITVGTPGDYAVGNLTGGNQVAINAPTLRIPFNATTNFYIDNEAAVFPVPVVNLGAPAVVNGVEVPAGRMFVPFRAVVNALNGNDLDERYTDAIVWHQGSPNENIPHAVTISLGDRTATFTIGSHEIVRGDRSVVPMVEGADVIRPFIGNGTVGQQDTMYLPIRFIAYAFGLSVDTATVAGNVVIN